MKGIYLFANRARHPNHDIVYNDIEERYKCDITANALSIPLDEYDFIIATPPCNWWSKANYRRNSSDYALATKQLLPETIKTLSKQSKPFIIENVRNKPLMTKEGVIDLIEKNNLFSQIVGRHLYISNVWCDLECPQTKDYKMHGIRINNDGYSQGGANVHRVIEIWINYIENGGNEMKVVNDIPKNLKLRLSEDDGIKLAFLKTVLGEKTASKTISKLINKVYENYGKAQNKTTSYYDTVIKEQR